MPIKDISENQDLEFKREWNNKCLEEICGMANAKGGLLYVGVEKNGEISGFSRSVADKLMDEIPLTIHNKLKIIPLVYMHQEGEKFYIEIEVEPADQPISLDESHFKRSGPVNLKLTGQILNDFIFNKGSEPRSWDSTIQRGATLDDIDMDTVEIFKKDAYELDRLTVPRNASLEVLLEHLRLYSDKGLTRAAIILFGKDYIKHYKDAYIMIGRFGDNEGQMYFHETCKGNLIQNITDSMKILKKNILIRPMIFGEIKRKEPLEYPEPALREMIINALVHRDYHVTERILIRVMNHCITVFSPGGLVPELTIEKLNEKPISKRRNPLIAEACYMGGYIEQFGHGITKIKNACVEADLLNPKFNEVNGGFHVELQHNISIRKSKSDKSKPQKTQLRNTRNEISVLGIISKNQNVTISEISTLTNLSRSGVNKIIRSLKDHGFIQREGSNKKGSWKVFHKSK